MVLRQRVVIDAVDDREVSAGRRGRDDDALGAALQVQSRLVAGGEDAGAFERDVDAELAVRQLRRVLDGGDLDRSGADVDRVAIDRDRAGEAAVHRIVAKQVGVGLDRAEIVDGDDPDIRTPALGDGA